MIIYKIRWNELVAPHVLSFIIIHETIIYIISVNLTIKGRIWPLCWILQLIFRIKEILMHLRGYIVYVLLLIVVVCTTYIHCSIHINHYISHTYAIANQIIPLWMRKLKSIFGAQRTLPFLLLNSRFILSSKLFLNIKYRFCMAALLVLSKIYREFGD